MSRRREPGAAAPVANEVFRRPEEECVTDIRERTLLREADVLGARVVIVVVVVLVVVVG